MTRAVDVSQADVVVDWRALPVLIGYISTLIPFYHGALRHLVGRAARRSASANSRVLTACFRRPTLAGDWGDS
ncbi:MAG: hypothetical protein LC808_00900, partial [Actinobacteria bacterium]|nr:hypothetical protein [Actinomycetota bacterium]